MTAQFVLVNFWLSDSIYAGFAPASFIFAFSQTFPIP